MKLLKLKVVCMKTTGGHHFSPLFLDIAIEVGAH
jgi:hypothetical protein